MQDLPWLALWYSGHRQAVTVVDGVSNIDKYNTNEIFVGCVVLEGQKCAAVEKEPVKDMVDLANLHNNEPGWCFKVRVAVELAGIVYDWICKESLYALGFRVAGVVMSFISAVNKCFSTEPYRLNESMLLQLVHTRHY